MNVVLLIPAYNPGHALIAYVEQLSQEKFLGIVVVDDGSRQQCAPIFDALRKIPRVNVLEHAVNLGKGMALKTGLNYAYVTWPELIGVVTADADGQHHVDDVLAVSKQLKESRDSLVIGIRQFDGEVPLRSRIGNGLTKLLYRLLVGAKLSDTQSGLRGIPKNLILKILKVPSNGYEFELDMLLVCQHTNRAIVEHPIRTIYIHGNRSSHFNPLFDSMKIYFVLFRSVIVSLITVAIDTAIFIPTYQATGQLLTSQFTGRFISMIFQYTMAKKVVFYSDKKHSETLPIFAFLVVAFGLVSYGFIKLLTAELAISVAQAKVISETVLYLAGFTMQRDFVFTQRKNWT